MTFGVLATTKRAGTDAALAIERRYLARLARVASFRLEGDTRARGRSPAT
jgi:hypothetical protein